MGFAGEITTIGLPELFRSISFNRLTGVLTVRAGGEESAIYFVEGRIRAHTTEFDYEAIAVRSGAATPTAVEKAKARGRRVTLKTALQADGSSEFDADHYDRALDGALKEEVLRLFDRPDISFVFDEETPAPGMFDTEQLACELAIDAEDLAMEAARRHDEWDRISRHVTSEAEVFVAIPGAAGEDLPPEAAKLLPLLDGTRDLAAALDQLPYGRFGMLRLVAMLVERGALERATPSTLSALADAAAKAGTINRAALLLGSAIERDPENLEICHQLVKLFDDAGRKAEAALAYKRLACVQEAQGDIKAAVESYEAAVELAPHDTDAIDRIASIHDARGDARAYLKAGRRLAVAYSSRGRHDEAVTILQDLLERDPENIKLRETLATTYIKMHEPQNAAQELLSLAESAAAVNGYHRALHYYRSVLAVDRKCGVAARRIEEIESGRAGERRRERRRRIICGAVTFLVGLAVWQGLRELSAQEALNRAADASAGASDAHSLAHYALIGTDFPYTRGAARAEDIARSRLLAALDRIRILHTHDLDAAERLLGELGRVHFPASARAIWRDARDRLVRRLATARVSASTR